MTTSDTKAQAARGADFVYAMAGIADLAVSRTASVIRQVQGVLARSDLAMLVGDGRADLLRRGELAVGRRSHVSEAHLETLARRAAERRNAAEQRRSAAEQRPGADA